MQMNSMFILRGITGEGNEVFYTGKAGQAFTSALRGESFGYVSKVCAQHRAQNLNEMHKIHGIWFVVVPFDQTAEGK